MLVDPNLTLAKVEADYSTHPTVNLEEDQKGSLYGQ